MSTVTDHSYRAWMFYVFAGCAAVALILFPALWLSRSAPPPAEERDIFDYPSARQISLREGKPMLLFFTGRYSVNSQYVALHSLRSPSINPLLRQFVLVNIYTDRVPNLKIEDSDIVAEQHNKWMFALCDNSFCNPGLIVFEPDRRQIFDVDGTPKGKVIDYFCGKAEDSEVAALLRKSLRH